MCDDSFEVIVHHGNYIVNNGTLIYSNGETEQI